ncbi:MAG: hypothetical protein ACOC56_00805, partial [Atribacterota bacterium]
RETKLSRFKIPQKKDDKVLNNRWLKHVKQKNYNNMKYLIEKKRKETILYGLEAEAVSTKRLNKELEDKMLPILGKKEDYLREWELENLNERIKELILHKITGG